MGGERAFSIGAVIAGAFVAALYLWLPGWSFPRLGNWLEQTATPGVEDSVVVLVVDTPENVEIMRAAVHPDRIVAEAEDAFALDEGRVIAASREAVGEAVTAAGWVHRRLEIMLPRQPAPSPEPARAAEPNPSEKPLISRAEAMRMLNQLD